MRANTRFGLFSVIGLVMLFSLACESPKTGSGSTIRTSGTIPKAECISIIFSGRGDDLIDVDSSKQGGCAKVTMTHDGAENFIVVPYDNQNNRMLSYANEIGRYEGASKWNGVTDMIEIDADGGWTIKVE